MKAIYKTVELLYINNQVIQWEDYIYLTFGPIKPLVSFSNEGTSLESNVHDVVKATVTLNFDQLTPKSIGVLYWSWPTSKPNLRTESQSVV